MSVRRIKQLVGVVGIWFCLGAVVVVVGAAALSVVATGTGADPELAFTDPNGERVDRRATWPAGSSIDSQIDDETRAQVEAMWHEAMATLQSGEVPPGSPERFSTAFSRNVVAPIPGLAVGEMGQGQTALELVFADENLELLRVRGKVDFAYAVGDDVVVTLQTFEATLVQQPAGWMVLHLNRVEA